MAFKEVSRVEVVEIMRRWQAGVSIRALTRATGLSRNTVNKYIAAAQGWGLTRAGPAPSEDQILALVQLGMAGPRKAVRASEGNLAPRAEQIRTWLEKDRLKLTRIYELLGGKDSGVSYMSLYRFVSRQGWRPGKQGTVRMADTRPGEMAEIDFGRLGLIPDPGTGRRRVAWALVVTLGYSRHCFVWPLFRQQLVDVIEGLEAAWGFYGGIPRYLVLDNFPASVAGPDALTPRLTRGFLEYSQRRGFIPDTARVAHPRDKPKVEAGVKYVRERLFKGGQFHDLADLRIQSRRWCLEVAGTRVHGTTCQLPLVVFNAQEKAALLAWDGEPYEMPDWKTVVVHPDHHVSYGCALYSAPHHTCPPGTKLEVRGDGKLVRLYHRGVLIKAHPRQPRGGRATDHQDYPPELTRYTLRCPDQLRRQGAELGAAVGAFADKLLGGPLPWAKVRQAQKLLRLGERYTPARLDAACRTALDVDLIDVRRLERILVEALENESQPPEVKAAPPPGRFALPGNAFACHGLIATVAPPQAAGNERTTNP